MKRRTAIDGTIYGTGPVQWEAVRAGLGGWAATWHDLDGWHCRSELPSSAPVTPFIWATCGESLARIRPGDNDAIAAVFCRDPADLPGSLPIAQEQAVIGFSEAAISWDENRLGAPFKELLSGHRQIRLITIDGTAPLTFVDLGESSAR